MKDYYFFNAERSSQVTTRDYMASMIREFRKAKGLTTEELGELVGRSKSAVEAWEIGRTQPDADKLIELCRVLDVDIPDFFGPSLSRKRGAGDDGAKELIDLYQSMDRESRNALMLVARGLACALQGAGAGRL